MSGLADWASVIVTLFLGVAGWLIARNINRDLQLKLAERRLAAYERLWALMRVASPYDAPLDKVGRGNLHKDLTDWYYAHGDGMMLHRATRVMYLQVKDNLFRTRVNVVSDTARQRLMRLDEAEADLQHGKLIQRQLSLLRTQMKSDVEIYGRPYGDALNDEDRGFLIACGVDLNAKPWRDASNGEDDPLEVQPSCMWHSAHRPTHAVRRGCQTGNQLAPAHEARGRA